MTRHVGYSAFIAMLAVWIVASAVQSQTLLATPRQQGMRTVHLNADGFKYSFTEPIGDNESTKENISGGIPKPPSALNGCGAVGSMIVETNPSGTDSLEFVFSTDATRIDSVHFVFHDLCGFSRLEVGSRSTPGQVIDAQTCTAKWPMTCIVNIMAGHRLTFDLNAKIVIDSVQSVNSCGTICAVRQFSFSLTRVEFVSTEIPDKSTLDQNYPNPFNPSTTIRFSIRVPGFTSLKIFDEIGREVTTLVNHELRPGRYEVTFDASGLTSGAYFYRLQAGVFAETRKLILLR